MDNFDYGFKILDLAISISWLHFEAMNVDMMHIVLGPARRVHQVHRLESRD